MGNELSRRLNASAIFDSKFGGELVVDCEALVAAGVCLLLVALKDRNIAVLGERLQGVIVVGIDFDILLVQLLVLWVRALRRRFLLL